jgi:hypothetical protein
MHSFLPGAFANTIEELKSVLQIVQSAILGNSAFCDRLLA